ncbi:hypothetical protein [Micromonospora sp. DPT]|uniref:hypothetical protein n=1 Tax=Micromonospora sp. DPT TaxID=3142975 RepID=UPI003207B1DD
MTTAELPTPVTDKVEDQLGRDLAALHARARQVAAELTQIYARLAVLEEEVRRHQQRP